MAVKKVDEMSDFYRLQTEKTTEDSCSEENKGYKERLEVQIS
jgi:hypothetical protein